MSGDVTWGPGEPVPVSCCTKFPLQLLPQTLPLESIATPEAPVIETEVSDVEPPVAGYRKILSLFAPLFEATQSLPVLPLS